MDLIVGHLKWPWVGPVVLVAVLALLVWWARRPRRRARDPLLVAHVAQLRALPRYRVLTGRRRFWGLALTGAALTIVAGTTLIMIRPQVSESAPRAPRNRDIMLCLDASASMDRYNVQVVQEMRRIVSGLHGDRVGMVIWSGAAVQVFPLTDDYDYVQSELALAEDAFSGKHTSAFLAGVDLDSDKASLIGDGIVSCVNRFDQPVGQRTRAVLVSSDNQPVGTPAYPLPVAAKYAASHHVFVYGIGAASLAKQSQRHAREEFAAAMEQTGGTFAVLGESGGADHILSRIDDLEKARVHEPPRPVSRDVPDLGLLVTGAGAALGVLALAGRRLSRGVRWRRR